MQIFSIKTIRSRNKKIYLNIKTSPELFRTSQIPNFRELLLERLPNLQYHDCYNDQGSNFGVELEDTELAHVLEHILIELILQKDPNIPSVCGWTRWNWQKYPRWSYYIEISYPSNTLFFSALSEALNILNTIIEQSKIIVPKQSQEQILIN